MGHQCSSLLAKRLTKCLLGPSLLLTMMFRVLHEHKVRLSHGFAPANVQLHVLKERGRVFWPKLGLEYQAAGSPSSPMSPMSQNFPCCFVSEQSNLYKVVALTYGFVCLTMRRQTDPRHTHVGCRLPKVFVSSWRRKSWLLPWTRILVLSSLKKSWRS